MPRGQPFTHLCQQLAQLTAESHRADLHVHTNHSDGAWSPEEVVHRAAARGLGAIAITDHDTCSGFAGARAAAIGINSPPEVIAGVEITCEIHGREMHLLGYFLDPDEPALASALTLLRAARRERFIAMAQPLVNARLVSPEDLHACLQRDHALGRRDLAAMLVRGRHAGTIAEAFARYLRDGGAIALPKQCLPVGDAISLVHAAGGVTSWAHPPQDINATRVEELRDLGLDALEAAYPTFSSVRERQVRDLAKAAGLAVTGGSDCHGPTPVSRAIGARGVIRRELSALRQRCQNRPVQPCADTTGQQ